MATRAEKFKARQQRDAKPPKKKAPKRRRRDVPVDTAAPGKSASDRKVGQGASGTRNESARAARKGGPKLESSATGKPSRKSTRKTTGRAKTTSNLERRSTRAATSPKARNARAKAKKR